MSDSKPLRILHIASGDLWAGAEVQLYTLAKTLNTKPGISVNVVLLNHGKLEQKLSEAGINTIVLDESRLNGFQILHQLVRTIRELQPDVIHTHRMKENVLGSIAARLAGGIPSLRTIHGAPEHRPPWHHIPKRLIHYLDWFCGRYIQQRIIAVSEDLAIILEKEFPTNIIRVIENGIDLEALGNHNNTPVGSATAGHIFRIGIAGRLVPVKRIDIFIQVARYLLDHYPNLKTSFHIYGEGPLRTKLEMLSKELGTTGIVHFEGHSDDIGSKLKQLDILLMTSDHEGLPMILLEAMAMRTPIIAHAVGGVPNLLDQGKCGVLVAAQDASAYASEIHQLSLSPEKQKDYTENALIRVQKNYSAEVNANYYIMEYASILNI